MSDTLTVTLDPARLTVRPGEEATATLRLENPLPDPVSYQLRVGAEARAWVEVFPNQGQLFPGQTVRARVHVCPPPELVSDVYRVALLAGAADGRLQVARAELAVFVAEPVRETAGAAQSLLLSYAIEVTAEPVEASPLPPPARQWRIQVRNAGDIVDTFGFSTEGIRAGWVQLDPVELTLRPEQTSTTLLTVQPEAGLVGGDYPFTLNVFSALQPNQLTQLRLGFVVGARTRFSLAARPDVVESEGSADYELRVLSDPGNNATLAIDLLATDEAAACESLCEPSELTLTPGQTAISRLRVQARTLLNPDERRDYLVTIHATARPETPAPSQSAVVRLAQRGVRPPTLELQPRQQRGERETRYTLRLTNPAAVETTLLLAGGDEAAELDYHFEPAEVTVPAGGRAEAQVHVRARAYLEAEAPRPITFVVTAQRSNSQSSPARTSGVFTQQPVKPLQIEVIPPRQTAVGQARYHVRVRNARPEPVSVSLAARDEADALAYIWRGRAFQLAPRAEGSALLTVRPKYRLAAGSDHQPHDFSVLAEIGDDTAPPTASARLIQERGVDWPRLVKRIVIWAIVILVVWSALALLLDAMDQWQLAKFEREGNNPLTTFLRTIVAHPVAQGLRRLPLPNDLRGLVQWLVRCQFIPC